MKEDQKYFNHLNQFPIFQNHSVLETIKCKEGNHGIYVCFQKGCQFYPFMCNNKKCSCRKSHENCLKIQVQEFIQKIQKKALNPSSLILFHEKKIDQFIKKITLESNQIKQQFKDQILKYTKQISFSPSQLQVLLKIQQSNVESLKGNDFFNVYSQLKLKKKDQGNFDQQIQKQKIQSIWNQFETKVIKEMQLLNQKWKISLNKNQMKKVNNLFHQSKLIQTQKQFLNIKGFFDKRIESTTLLYRASQNQFKVANFHKSCDGIQNTLVIMQTEFGKKIGGFTTLKWKSQQNQYVSDTGNTSFTFSLTHNQKLVQTQTSTVGIVNTSNYGPIFGKKNWGYQLYIGQNSNINMSSGGYFSYCYTHPSYVNVNKQTRQRFTGNPNDSHNFKIKQWQVWKINLTYNV